ncbi:MAG TPA: tetratricopeptide repeat protein [Casimicrobiaceae bacterium]|nr:tetratricopeptide repeat protein [Casimicrobiaceae bacterium]
MILLLSLVLFLPQAPAQDPAHELDRLMTRAVQLHQAGDILGAIDAYQAALGIDPKQPVARSNLGAAYVKLGKYDEAIDQYQQALAIDGANPAIRLNLALAYYKAARLPEAAEGFQAVLAADPSSKQAVLLLGDTLLQTGRFQQVIDVLMPRQEEFSNDLGFAYVLGTALLRTGERVRAQVYLDRIFNAGESAEAHLLMGTALIESRQYPEAIAEFKKALELNPSLPTLRTVYARALMAAGDQEAAMRELRRAVAASPNDFEANLELGALLRRDEKHEESAAYLRRAVTLRPQDVTARFGLAGALLSLGSIEESRQMLEKVVADSPEYTAAHVMLATCYYRLKRTDDGDREKAVAERLRQKEQERQPGKS